GDYSRHDFVRTASLFGIPYRHPEKFPIATLAAARAFIHTRNTEPQQAPGLALALYRAFFAQGRDISDAEIVLDVARECGLDRDRMAAGIADETVKAQLKEEIANAMARGVF